jgi:hypothetical protein
VRSTTKTIRTIACLVLTALHSAHSALRLAMQPTSGCFACTETSTCGDAIPTARQRYEGCSRAACLGQDQLHCADRTLCQWLSTSATQTRHWAGLSKQTRNPWCREANRTPKGRRHGTVRGQAWTAGTAINPRSLSSALKLALKSFNAGFKAGG